MYERAMDKIRDEMAKSKGAVGMVGDIVTLYLKKEPANAEKILAEGKTLKGAYGAMRDYAREKRMECMDPDEAAERIAVYYGMEPVKIMGLWGAQLAEDKPEKAKTQAREDVDDLSIDAFLEL